MSDCAGEAIVTVVRVVAEVNGGYYLVRPPTAQPEMAQTLRNCCWKAGGIPRWNARVIRRPLTTPRIAPWLTP